MSTMLLPLLTALATGFTHALEADHVAAVTTFVARRPHPLHALRFGVRWGLGHSVALLLAGGALVLLDLELAHGVVRWLEVGVGAMLVGLGAWAVAGLLHARALTPAHRRAHEAGRPHSHVHVRGGGSLWVGMAHGLAGTAAFLALLPVALLTSPWMAGAYLLAFGIGTVAAMGAYAMIAGYLFHRAGSSAPAVGVGLRALAGCASVVIGALWILRAL